MKDEGRLDRIHVRIEWIIYSEDVYNKYIPITLLLSNSTIMLKT